MTTEEYRIDDLAREAGTTVRNVRVYQDRGLLPPPRRQGRTGYYDEAHLARLRLIGRLLERGYTFATMGELLAAWQEGREIGDLLGLERAVTQPWSSEAPTRMTLTELRRAFGRQAGPGAINRAVQLGLVQRSGRAFTVPSPRLLAAGADLVSAGVPLPTVLDLAEALRGDLAVVAHRFVEVFLRAALAESGGRLPTSDQVARLTRSIATLRPQAARAVEAVFAAAMEAEVSAAVGRILAATPAGAPLTTRER